MYVLDTNTLIYFFKGAGNVAGRLLKTPPQNVALPAVVIYELEVGIAKSRSPEKRKTQLQNFISATTVIPFGLHEARSAALIRARLEEKGKSIGPHDLLIAGTAMAHRAILVTHNTKEFKRIHGLALEDWY